MFRVSHLHLIKITDVSLKSIQLHVRLFPFLQKTNNDFLKILRKGNLTDFTNRPKKSSTQVAAGNINFCVIT